MKWMNQVLVLIVALTSVNAVLAADPPTAPTGQTCGGLVGKQCAKGQYCNYMDGTALAPSKCGSADQMGKCLTVPQICNDQYQPVCGCDGKTYSNACEAHVKGVTVSKPGKCPASGHVDGAADSTKK